GRSCGVGCARIGAYPKRNSRSTWDSSSSCTTSASEAKRCCLRSLSSWSHKTLESNKSVHLIRYAMAARLGPPCCRVNEGDALLQVCPGSGVVAQVEQGGPELMVVVRNNRIAALPADEFADRPHGVQGKAPLDNKAPSSDNSSA